MPVNQPSAPSQLASPETEAIYRVLNSKGPEFTEEYYNRLPGAIYKFDPNTQAWVLAGPVPSSQRPSTSTLAKAPSEGTLTNIEKDHQPQSPFPYDDQATRTVHQLNVISWNVDFMRPAIKTRLNTALSHLQSLVLGTTPTSTTSLPDRPLPIPKTTGHDAENTGTDADPSGPERSSTTTTTTPTIILIQELYYDCFPTLLRHPFVRKHYCVTDISPGTWCDPEANYGTVSLIPLSLIGNVSQVFRTGFPTTMYRDACYVDLLVGTPSIPLHISDSSVPLSTEHPSSPQHHPSTSTSTPQKLLRIANVHLESLREASDRLRIRQLKIVSDHLPLRSATSNSPEALAPGLGLGLAFDELTVDAGIVAGDMNPLGPLDPHIPSAFELNDAWIHCWGDDLGLDKDDERARKGHTWGYQPRSRWPPKRMDKVLFRGDVRPTGIEVIGKGLTVPRPEAFRELGDLREEDMIVLSDDSDDDSEGANWASDHYGLLAKFVIT